MGNIEEIKKLYLKKRNKIEDHSKNNQDLKEYKNGVYAFYDGNKLLYIGMVSNAKTASLYARMYGNGNSKHELKEWFYQIKEVYFYKLNTTDKYDIQVLERILIRELKPSENDLVFDDKEIEVVLEKMTSDDSN